jgi:hypothetical protein
MLVGPGCFRSIWRRSGANEPLVCLEAWDTISVPPGVMSGFRNVGREPACLMAILGGTDPGRVTWPPEVLEKAKTTGLRFDEHGNVIKG